MQVKKAITAKMKNLGNLLGGIFFPSYPSLCFAGSNKTSFNNIMRVNRNNNGGNGSRLNPRIDVVIHGQYSQQRIFSFLELAATAIFRGSDTPIGISKLNEKINSFSEAELKEIIINKFRRNPHFGKPGGISAEQAANQFFQGMEELYDLFKNNLEDPAKRRKIRVDLGELGVMGDTFLDIYLLRSDLRAEILRLLTTYFRIS